MLLIVRKMEKKLMKIFIPTLWRTSAKGKEKWHRGSEKQTKGEKEKGSGDQDS
jgi:hypothetical protein